MTFEQRARSGVPDQQTKLSALVSLVLRRLLKRIKSGQLTVYLPNGDRVAHRGADPGVWAELVLHDWRSLRRFLVSGRNGIADGFIAGEWSSHDLVSLLMLGASNNSMPTDAVSGAPLSRFKDRIMHRLNRNTPTGSRRNIAFHYDVGNEFFGLWLDRSMTYSAALFEDVEATLEQAQQQKLARILDLLDLRGGEKVLEIGCGWGALAHQLAERGADVIGLTLSERQRNHVEAKARESSFAGRLEVRMEDYREVKGQYDRVVSIEMLEAVGEAYWPTFFAVLRDRLKSGGVAVLQVITIDEARFERYRRAPDFIQRYIFPGGMLPTRRILAHQASNAGLSLTRARSFGQGYALTLAEWRRRFLAAWPEIALLGFDERFRRLWEFYLSYCEAGFRSGAIDVGLYTLRR